MKMTFFGTEFLVTLGADEQALSHDVREREAAPPAPI